jgi:hypothetical protein
MTHEERLALIHRSFPVERFTTTYPWGGALGFLDGYVLLPNGKRKFYGKEDLDGCGVTLDPEDDLEDEVRQAVMFV